MAIPSPVIQVDPLPVTRASPGDWVASVKPPITADRMMLPAGSNDGSVTLCIALCDPLIQDCGAGLGCFVTGSDFNCVFTTDEVPMGEPCGYINDCAPGNFCADAASLPSCDGSACCASFCNLEDPLCLLAQTECVSFFDEGMALPGFEDVGVCIVPS